MTLTGQLLQLLKKIQLRYKNKTNLQKIWFIYQVYRKTLQNGFQSNDYNNNFNNFQLIKQQNKNINYINSTFIQKYLKVTKITIKNNFFIILIKN